MLTLRERPSFESGKSLCPRHREMSLDGVKLEYIMYIFTLESQGELKIALVEA